VLIGKSKERKKYTGDLNKKNGSVLIIFPRKGRLLNLDRTRKNTQTILFQERNSVVKIHVSLF